ncbi:FtsX-like permease family protein [Streptomyces bullii]|uniref:FtsX-like permease family protein n=1 Tax=Streptomyces bullii TaxID=349910 RepID=A0ABW0UN59_9ACTN
MAAPDRVRELGSLRLAGATRSQVLRLVGAEALTVVAVGTALGLLVAGLNLAGMWTALGLLSVRTTIAVPWTALVTAATACAVLAVTAPAALALRRRAAAGAGARE